MVWSVLFRRSNDDLIVALWESGTCGIVEEDDTVRAYFSGDSAEERARLFASGFDGSDVRPELASGADSAALTEPEPILVGERFYIAEHPVSDAVTGGRLQLLLRTSSAFGTGRHETTQLCLRALERVLRPEDAVIDVGCGSGILSLAAQLLGAQRVIGCDIFEGTIAAAVQNVHMPVFIGSADALADQAGDLVVANLTDKVLDRLAADLRRITRPEGRLIVSGFLHESPPQSFKPEETLSEGDWLCWICRPEQIGSASSEGGLSHASEWWL